MRSQHYHKNPKYKLRKLSIGVVSFLSGFSFIIAGGSIASAEEIDPSHAPAKIESEIPSAEEVIVPEKKIATAEEVINPVEKSTATEESLTKSSPQVEENAVSDLNSQAGSTAFRMAAASTEYQVRYTRTVKVTLNNNFGYTGESLTVIVKSGATRETFTIPKISSDRKNSVYSGTVNALVDLSSPDDLGKLGNNLQLLIGDAPNPISASNRFVVTANGIEITLNKIGTEGEKPSFVFVNDSEIFSNNYDIFLVRLTNRYWSSFKYIAELKYKALPGFEDVVVPENKLIISAQDDLNLSYQTFYFKVPYGTRADFYGLGSPIGNDGEIATSEIPIENSGTYDTPTQFSTFTSVASAPILLDDNGIPTRPAFLDSKNKASLSTVKYTTSTPEGDRIKKIKESISLPPNTTVSITDIEIVGNIPSEPSTDPVDTRVIISYSDGSRQGANVPVIVTDDSVATPPNPPTTTAENNGSVSVTPVSDATKLSITYTKTGENTTTQISATKTDGTWKLDGSVDAGITIDATTGKVIIPESDVEDKTQVVSTNTDASNNVSDTSSATALDVTPPTSPRLATNGGDVTITPTSDDTTKISVSYTNPEGNKVSITANKGNDNTWTLENTPQGVTIDSSTGVITLNDTATKDDTEVSATSADEDNNTSTPAKETTPDITAPTPPAVSAKPDGSVTITPAEDATGITITYTKTGDNTPTTITATKTDDTWTIPTPQTGVTIDPHTGVVTITETAVEDDTPVKATDSDKKGNISTEAQDKAGSKPSEEPDPAPLTPTPKPEPAPSTPEPDTTPSAPVPDTRPNSVPTPSEPKPEVRPSDEASPESSEVSKPQLEPRSQQRVTPAKEKAEKAILPKTGEGSSMLAFGALGAFAASVAAFARRKRREED